jgi:GH18 family chitinase
MSRRAGLTGAMWDLGKPPMRGLFPMLMKSREDHGQPNCLISVPGWTSTQRPIW